MKKIRWICLFLISVLLLGGCGMQGNNTDSTQVSVKNPVSGGVLKLYAQKPDTYNPLTTKISSVSQILSLVYEPLYRLGSDIKPVGVLARTHSVSPDGLTYQIFLQERVTFQDGSRFTAQDVVYTVQQIRQADSIYQSNLYNVESISAASDSELTIVLKTKDYHFLSLLNFPIIKNGSAASTMEGTGPYRFVDVSDHTVKKMSAYADWHGTHKPYISEVEVIIREDALAAANAFQINRIDVFELPYTYVDQVTLSKQSSKVILPTNFMTFIGINSTHPILNDPQVRTALSMLTDKDKIISQVMFTNAVATAIPINPRFYLYPTAYAQSAYQVKNAVETLKSVGFGQKNSAGVLQRADVEGNIQTLSLTLLLCEGDARREQIADMLVSSYLEGGVKLNLEKLPYEEYTEKIQNNEYDLYLGDINLLNNFDLSALLVSAPEKPSLSGYQNEQMHAYLAAIGAASDESQKISAYEQFAAFFKQETPFIPICFNDNVLYYNQNIHGVSDLFFEMPLQNCYDWFISSETQ